MFESLHSLSDSQIVSGSKAARAQEHSGMLSSLGFIVETERRQIHLKSGCSSLFDYCVRKLGYSESQAMRRITAARCIVKFPQAFAPLLENEINLSTLSRVSKILTPENCLAVLSRIRGKSLREVEAVVAEYEPVAAFPRDRIRTIVARVPAASVPAVGQNHLRNDGKKPSSVEELTLKTPMKPPVERATHMFERRARVEFTAKEALIAKLDHLRSLVSHRVPINASLEQLIEFMADYVIQREDPEARQKRRETRAERGAAASAIPSSPREIAARERDQVFVRDRQCSFIGPDGKRCGSTHVLQVDHIEPVARGGASTIDNLRLLCAFHNRLEAERVMGRSGPRR
jgi:5-methylcytosine-specific restriction endonuclease McrA